jgi:bacillithiol biosynthesis cysteine-adding enzyme BshC
VYRSECLPFNEIPHHTPLFLDFLYSFHKVERFLPEKLQTAEQAAQAAKRISYDATRRAAVADALERQNADLGTNGLGDAARRNLQRFRAGAAAVVSGHQVSLFGGPAYSFYKAMTAIKTAEELSRAGVECVPIYWLAAEDHDLAEIDHVTLPASPQTLETVRVTAEGKQDAPVGRMRLNEASLAAGLERMAELLGTGEALDMLRVAYAPGVTSASGIARLFARVFADYGLLLINPDDAQLHRIAQPVLEGIVERSAELNAAVQKRGKELEAARYHQQVKVTSATSFLFALRDGVRIPVRRNGAGFAIGDRKLSVADVQRQVAAAPEDFSAAALLRTSVQNFLLPTLLYAGGPAEIAYLAQAAPLEQALTGRATPVMHRFSATLVDARAQRLLQKYGLKVSDTFHGTEQLRERIAQRCLPAELEAKFESAKKGLEWHIGDIREQLAAADPTLLRAAERAAKKMGYQLDRLRAKAARAVLRRSEELSRHAEQLSVALYPHKELQERTVPGIYFLARMGTAGLRELYATLKRECADHQVVFV